MNTIFEKTRCIIIFNNNIIHLILGLGISSEHCKISVEEGIPYIEPFTGR